MKCPLCGSEITAGSKYCPVCGADVEAARRRSQASAQQVSRPTQPVPQQTARAQQRPQAQQARRGAVPMNSSLPTQQSQNLREFDTKSMNSMPKWPIVLIVLLVLVIVVAVVLLLTKPWETGGANTVAQTPSTTSGTVDGATSSSGQQGITDTQGTDVQPATTEQTSTGEQTSEVQTASQTLTDAEAYAQLQAIYETMGTLDSSISGVANDFNTSYVSSDQSVRQSCLDNALAVQASVNDAIEALSALSLSEGSQYVDTVSTYENLLNDLKMRIDVLVEGWQNSVNGLSESEIIEPVGRYNGTNGISTYKADFDANYPSSAPAAPVA